MNANKKQEEKKKISKQSFQKLLKIFRYTFPYKGVFFIGMIFLLLSTSASLAFPYIASLLADTSMGKNDWGINQIGFLLAMVLVLQGIFSYGRIVLFAIVSEKAMGDIRKDLYKKLITLPLVFFEERRVGELTSRITADVTQLQSTLSTNLAEFFRQIATLVVGILIIAFTSVKLTLLMLSTFPVAIIAAIFFSRYIRKFSKQTQDALADANVVVEETLQSVQVVKAFTNEWHEKERYNHSINQVVKLALKAANYRGMFVSFLISAVFGGIVIVLWYGAGLVENGTMTIGELLRFILYTFFIGGAVGGAGSLYSDLQKAIGSSERVIDILGETSEVKNIEPVEKQLINGNIIYKNVQFSYPTRKDIKILKNISFAIQEGQKIALVGPSGAGKSTIIQLLLRFYELNKGQISINGKGINEYNISQLRSNIGIVPQEVMLFGGTILENIKYGNEQAAESVVIKAAKKANAWDFIQQFPEALHTVVGERGVKLSGGQRQRIAIARAILKDPAILILDEATSSLDAESEKLVQDALNELMKNRTTIIIAHRLATVRKVDCIYVLEDGEIVEQGTHQELSAKKDGLYQNLVKLQFELM